MNTPNTSPLTSLDSFQVETYNPGAFAGGTANARGDHDGTSDPTTLFTVTGEVMVRMYGVILTACTSGGTPTIEVGVTGNTAALLAQNTDATAPAANDIWVGGTTHALGVDALGDIGATQVVVNGLDIIETIGTANITAGEISYTCLWRPLTSGSKVEPGS